MANTTLDVKIQIRNDTKNNWTTQNPVLLKGEMGVETDTRKFPLLERPSFCRHWTLSKLKKHEIS